MSEIKFLSLRSLQISTREKYVHNNVVNNAGNTIKVIKQRAIGVRGRSHLPTLQKESGGKQQLR